MTPTPSDPRAHDTAEPVEVSGRFTKRQLRTYARAMRSGDIGPTSVYYAGVTAPAIAAGMATLSGKALIQLGWSDYWVWMVGSLLAAMAGISWYLIFMRWSYRHRYGREGETGLAVTVRLDDSGLVRQSGGVSLHVDWSAIRGVTRRKKALHIAIDGADDLFLPDAWFATPAAFERAHELLVHKMRDRSELA